VRGESRKDLTLLALGYLEEIERASKFSRHFIEFLGRDPKFAMRLLQTKGRTARFRCREWKGPPDTSQTQRVRMNFKPGNLPCCSTLHSFKAAFFEPLPTAGFATTASLK